MALHLPTTEGCAHYFIHLFAHTTAAEQMCDTAGLAEMLEGASACNGTCQFCL